jgi:hypothetical protein
MALARSAILRRRRCHVPAYALEQDPKLGFHARWIKPAGGFTGNHIFVMERRHSMIMACAPGNGCLSAAMTNFEVSAVRSTSRRRR